MAIATWFFTEFLTYAKYAADSVFRLAQNLLAQKCIFVVLGMPHDNPLAHIRQVCCAGVFCVILWDATTRLADIGVYAINSTI